MAQDAANIAGPPPAAARLGAVGIFYISLSATWTILVAASMCFLWTKRRMSFLRIRGLPLSFAAVGFLHAYATAALLGYIYGALMPEWVEYWIMAVWLPFGVALFHASNSRFLYVAEAQRRFAQTGLAAERRVVYGRGVVDRFLRLEHSTRMLVYVGLGMACHLLLTVIMFLVSRKYHPWFGAPGTEAATPADLGKGWEWWPSVFWQFLWAWIVAPVILWQARNVHDTQGWRLQTIACCISNLHATPMWLVALYVPAMAPVNSYFIPPCWIAVSIMFIEAFTLFIPCWQVFRHQTLKQETLDSIAIWEAKKKGTGAKQDKNAATRSLTSSTTRVSVLTGTWKSMSSVEKGQGSGRLSIDGQRSIMTMEALEHVLESNPQPLQQFSALKDFSGENIAFLSAVASWKAVSGELSLPEIARERFNRALRIYTDFISPRDAEFPVNISSADLKKLEAVFETAARSCYGEASAATAAATATPFALMLVPASGVDALAQRSPSPVPSSFGSERMVLPASPSTITNSNKNATTDAIEMSSTMGGSTAGGLVPADIADLSDRVQYWGDIPDGFDDTVFDEAQLSIKYLVLTNTWPKFVRARRSSDGSEQTVRSDGSDRTVTSRITEYIKSIF